VLRARVPIILTSRADSVITRLASCAVECWSPPRDARRPPPRSTERGVNRTVRIKRQSKHQLMRGRKAMADCIAVINAGSSSIKLGIYEAATENKL
jgi:hypothetical protein